MSYCCFALFDDDDVSRLQIIIIFLVDGLFNGDWWRFIWFFICKLKWKGGNVVAMVVAVVFLQKKI